MKDFNIYDFVWAVWRKQQLLMILIIVIAGLYFYFSQIVYSKSFDPYGLNVIIIIFGPPIAGIGHLFFSAIVYLIYQLLLTDWTNHSLICTLYQLKIRIRVLNIFIMFIGSLCFWGFGMYLTEGALINTLVIAGGIFLSFALIGQIAIFWVINYENPFENVKFSNPKINTLIEEIGN